MASGPGLWARLVHSITADDDALDAQVLARGTETEGACSCAQAVLGEKVTVVGRLRSVVYTPSEKAPALIAELFDGSGTVRLVWLGQRRIPGIEPGRTLKVRGRVADRAGERTIYNPWYELQQR